MAHKVHPKAFRLRRMKDWDSRGFYGKNFSSNLEEDFKIREFFKDKIRNFRIGKIVIERFPNKINIIVFTTKPGLIIGRAGEGIEKLKSNLFKTILKGRFPPREASQIDPVKYSKEGKLELKIEIREIKNPWTSASLVAQLMAMQIEKRTAFRKVLKRTLSKVISQKGVKGVRLQVSGRLNGVSIARREWLKEGLLPRQTLRADIDYAKDTAFCTYGAVGMKVWIYKGEKSDE
jgi:small subunit ribosomal protein S3